MFYAKDNALLYAFADVNQRDHEVSVQGITPIHAKEAHKLYGKNPAVDCDTSNFVPEGGYHILSLGLRKPGVHYPMSICVHGFSEVEASYEKRLRDMSYHDVHALLEAALSSAVTYGHGLSNFTYEFSPGVIHDNIKFWVSTGGQEPICLIRITDMTANR